MRSVVEVKRLSKNQQLRDSQGEDIRAPIEVLVAIFNLLTGPMRMVTDAFVGDIEEGIVKRKLEYFHVPMVVIRGALPVTADDHYLRPHFEHQVCVAFACLVSDLQYTVLQRLQTIEAALDVPGRSGLQQLLQLRRSSAAPRSSLEPEAGLSTLDRSLAPRHGTSMASRRRFVEDAGRLRSFAPFNQLTIGEAMVLRDRMMLIEVAAADAVIHEGEDTRSLYLILDGTASVQRDIQPNGRRIVRILEPGDIFGEIALVTGARRTADVVACSPLRLLCLEQTVYAELLGAHPEVQGHLTHIAASRLTQPPSSGSGEDRPRCRTLPS
jgi:hypothetical protein